MHLTWQFVKAYKKYRPDIVQHFTVKPVIYGTIAAHLCGVKHIFNMVPGMGYVFTGKSFKKSWVQTIVRLLYRSTMKYSSHVFFQNNDDRNYFLQYHIVDERMTSVVSGTGVDIEKFKPIKKKHKKGITFIMAARMLWDKGIGEYVKAARFIKSKYRNTHFWLLGPVDLQNPKGIKPEQLQHWNEEGIIEYLGMTDNIRSYMQKADVIVLPSYYREGIPLSLLEGAAMGMPIITTDSTGCREVVEDGKNGFLVPIRDVAKLSSAMERFTKKPMLVSRMGKESRKLAVKKFDSRRIVKEILKFYPL
jgi:glycosyltransferase involved in cell wall biosynthesis